MKPSYSTQRLYRDTDRAIISGICAGAARQVNVDPLWVRAAAVAGALMMPTVFLGGYLLGVILIPKRG